MKDRMMREQKEKNFEEGVKFDTRNKRIIDKREKDEKRENVIMMKKWEIMEKEEDVQRGKDRYVRINQIEVIFTWFLFLT